MTRRFGAVLGLAAGLATLVAAGPASAIHIFLEAMGQGTLANPIDGVVTRPAGATAIAQLGDPLTLFGSITDDAGTGVSFAHRYEFGFDTTGTGGASATPNPLFIGANPEAGFATFQGTVTGPGIGTVNLGPVGGTTTIAATFAAIDTRALSDSAPYVLTLTGSLLAGVTAANYTSNIGVVPLPGAAVLFLTALGGLAFARRYRRREEEDGMAAAA